MAKDSVKDRNEHRGGERERSGGSDRSAASSSSRSGRDSRDKDRVKIERSSSRDELGSREVKRLRNEGEPRHSSGTSVKVESQSVRGTLPITKLKSSATLPSGGHGSAKKADEVPSAFPMNKKEVYEGVVEFENNEAKWLNAPDAVKECQMLCKNLESNTRDILGLKHGSVKDPADVEDKMEEGIMMLMSIRRLNRLMKIKLKLAKEDQLAMRNEVDTDHLLLQNLLYEATHLQNQVAAVQDYKGMDENIDLIPVSQFFEEAPEQISKPGVTSTDPHLLRIARLEYEFTRRQNLMEDCNVLEKEKEQVLSRIDEQQAQLDSIKPLLANVLEATKPLQSFFGLNITAQKEQNLVAQYLPLELYVLFVQSEAFREAEEKADYFIINICGNLGAAKELVVTPEEVEEDSDSDKEQELEMEISERRLKRKKSSIMVSPEESRNKLIQKHPLWIEWKLKSKDGDLILIQFFYLIKLKIVTVKAEVINSSSEYSNKSMEKEIESADTLLPELFPGDVGTESPNPANIFLFQKVDASGISEFLNITGKPYRWAQELAGVEFPNEWDILKYENEAFSISPKMKISAVSIGKILKLIRKRLANQTKLWRQLKVLDTKNIQVPVAAKKFFPSKTSTTFKSWESITWNEYRSYDCSSNHIRTDSVSDKNMHFKATLERGRAKLTALIELSLDFPTVPPLFCVQLEQDGELRNAANDSAVRDLEKEINIYAPNEFSEWADVLVTLQLQRLIQCTDVILETDIMFGDSSGPSEFSREKLFLQGATGRNSRRPFKYFPTGGGYYSQRY